MAFTTNRGSGRVIQLPSRTRPILWKYITTLVTGLLERVYWLRSMEFRQYLRPQETWKVICLTVMSLIIQKKTLHLCRIGCLAKGGNRKAYKSYILSLFTTGITGSISWQTCHPTFGTKFSGKRQNSTGSIARKGFGACSRSLCNGMGIYILGRVIKWLYDRWWWWTTFKVVLMRLLIHQPSLLIIKYSTQVSYLYSDYPSLQI